MSDKSKTMKLNNPTFNPITPEEQAQIESMLPKFLPSEDVFRHLYKSLPVRHFLKQTSESVSSMSGDSTYVINQVNEVTLLDPSIGEKDCFIPLLTLEDGVATDFMERQDIEVSYERAKTHLKDALYRNFMGALMTNLEKMHTCRANFDDLEDYCEEDSAIIVHPRQFKEIRCSKSFSESLTKDILENGVYGYLKNATVLVSTQIKTPYWFKKDLSGTWFFDDNFKMWLASDFRPLYTPVLVGRMKTGFLLDTRHIARLIRPTVS